MLGKIVLYKMRAQDCGFSSDIYLKGQRVGNQSSPGDLVPAIITRVWPDEFQGAEGRVDGYNITVLPDGPTPLWITSTKFGDGDGEIRLVEEV